MFCRFSSLLRVDLGFAVNDSPSLQCQAQTRPGVVLRGSPLLVVEVVSQRLSVCTITNHHNHSYSKAQVGCVARIYLRCLNVV